MSEGKEYKLDLNSLVYEYNESITSTLIDRRDVNRRERFNEWAGQSPDARKWKKNIGATPVPFDGCSDSRVPLVDNFVQEDVDMLMTSLRQMRVTASPTESGDAKRAFLVSNLMRWMMENQMSEFFHEAELAANYYCENGMSVVGIHWHRETNAAYRQINLETIKQYAMQQPPDSPAYRLPELIADPDMDDVSMEISRELLEAPLKDKAMKRMLNDLRKEGFAQYIAPELIKNRPQITALRVGEDFFFPQDTMDLQTARRLYWRQFMTESQLKDAKETQGWDSSWVDQVLDRAKGLSNAEWSGSSQRLRGSKPGLSDIDTRELYEVVHGFERRCDENGVPGIYYVVFCPHYTTNDRGDEIVALNELLNYAHGQYPFVALRREHLSRRLDDSRGYGEVASTWQTQIKREFDGRTDRSYLSTMPPLMHPVGRAPSKWGPGVMVPRLRPDDYQYADMPRGDAGSKEVEMTIQQMADRYFGRPVGNENVFYARMRQQGMVAKWLKYWSEICKQSFQLIQQFMDDEMYFRVVGSRQAEPIQISRDEIQGQYDISIHYNVANLDMELVKEKLQLLKLAVDFDVNGVVDRTTAMEVLFEHIDPQLGERMLRPQEQASLQEIEEERTAFAQMFAGADVDIKPGQAHQLRLQELQRLSESPTAKRQLQSDPSFQERLVKRAKQHEHQLVQQQNAQIGRLGA
tara:strand:- start:4955 stop:7030 length:2076 start_codon:yes stop_codon:yes gene_type:complete